MVKKHGLLRFPFSPRELQRRALSLFALVLTKAGQVHLISMQHSKSTSDDVSAQAQLPGGSHHTSPSPLSSRKGKKTHCTTQA